MQVRKSYEQRRARRRARGEKRPWQLKRMDMESEEAAAPTRAAERKAAAAAEDDMERFLEVSIQRSKIGLLYHTLVAQRHSHPMYSC